MLAGRLRSERRIFKPWRKAAKLSAARTVTGRSHRLKQKAHLSASSIMASVLSGPAAPLPANGRKRSAPPPAPPVAAWASAPRARRAFTAAALPRTLGVGCCSSFLCRGRCGLGRKAGRHDLLAPHRLFGGAERGVALDFHDAAPQLLLGRRGLVIGHRARRLGGRCRKANFACVRGSMRALRTPRSVAEFALSI